jgi:uncharacterized protein (DUF433 family)
MLGARAYVLWRRYPMGTARQIYPGVVVDPEVVHGKPVLAGTRIPVTLVLGQLAAGVDFDELEREYGVTRQEAQAAIGYAAQLVASASVYTSDADNTPNPPSSAPTR